MLRSYSFGCQVSKAHWRGIGVILVKTSYPERQFILMLKYLDGHVVF